MTLESPQGLTPDSRIELHDDELKENGRIVLSDTRDAEVLDGPGWALMDEDDNVGATLTRRWNFARIVEALLRLPRPFATIRWDRVRGEFGHVRGT
jgi:hypothetical protein